MTIQHRERLMDVHEGLMRVLLDVGTRRDILIVYGHRGQADQDHAFSIGNSRVKWPFSQHNAMPARACDVAPLPLDWNDIAAFQDLAADVLATAARLGVALIWGGNFKTLKDFDHFEIDGGHHGGASGTGAVSTA